MSDRALTIVSRPQGNNRAVLDGSIPVEGIELDVVDIPVLVHGFRRMVRQLEFDVSEMALTTYLCAKDHGVAFTALPIFLVRGLHHGAIFRRRGSGTVPADLVGGRVGISRGYTVTTGVWARAILDEEHGVDPREVTWVPSGDEHVEDFEAPPNVQAELGIDLGQALADGQLDAAIGARIDHADVEPLLDDPIDAGLRSLTERGLYPINHCIVVRDDVLRSDPSIAERLYRAFCSAKDSYVSALRSGPEPADPTDALYRQIAHATGDDPLPYGLEANRATLERLVDHALKQRIIRTSPDLDALFIDPDHA